MRSPVDRAGASRSDPGTEHAVEQPNVLIQTRPRVRPDLPRLALLVIGLYVASYIAVRAIGILDVRGTAGPKAADPVAYVVCVRDCSHGASPGPMSHPHYGMDAVFVAAFTPMRAFESAVRENRR